MESEISEQIRSLDAAVTEYLVVVHDWQVSEYNVEEI